MFCSFSVRWFHVLFSRRSMIQLFRGSRRVEWEKRTDGTRRGTMADELQPFFLISFVQWPLELHNKQRLSEPKWAAILKEEIAQPTHAHTYVHICIWFLCIVTYPQRKKGAKHFGIVYCINSLGHVLHLMLHTKLTNQNWTLWINWRLCSSSFSIFLPSFSTIYLSIFVRVRVCFAFVILFFFSVCLFVYLWVRKTCACLMCPLLLAFHR